MSLFGSPMLWVYGVYLKPSECERLNRLGKENLIHGWLDKHYPSNSDVALWDYILDLDFPTPAVYAQDVYFPMLLPVDDCTGDDIEGFPDDPVIAEFVEIHDLSGMPDWILVYDRITGEYSEGVLFDG